MVAEPGRPGMDIVTTQFFQMVGKVTGGMSSKEETSKEKFEDEKQKEEDSVASFPAVLNNAVDHAGSSNESAGICRTNTLMKTMNHLDELSREAENCWTWMKATCLDDEASMEDSMAPVDSNYVQRQDMLEQKIIELKKENHTRRVVEDDDDRDLHGNCGGHVNLSWGSGFGSETVDEEKECESIDDDEPKRLTLGDLPLQSMCSPKSKHLSPVEGRLNIPARSPGTPELETRKTMSGPAGEAHRVQQAVARQIWFRFEGKTRAIDIWGQDSEIEEEIREKMKIEKRWDICMTNEGTVVGWRDLEEVRDGGMVEIGLRMRGGGKKKKWTSGNQRENLVSGGESTGSEETENSTGDEAKKDAVLHEIMSKAKVEGGPMHEMIETLAVLGQREREEMQRWYEDKIPEDTSKAKHEVGLLGIRWMVEKKIEENQGMLKEEVMKDGMKKGTLGRATKSERRATTRPHVTCIAGQCPAFMHSCCGPRTMPDACRRLKTLAAATARHDCNPGVGQ